MWIYNNVNYMCEPLEILLKIREQVSYSGREILKDIKQTNNAIMFTCPWHGGGQEKKPSCGLITKQKSKDSIPAGKVHCFSCGVTANLEEFISNCFGIYDGGLYGMKWLASNFLQMEIGGRPKLDLSNQLSRIKHEDKINYISEDELESYRYIHQYMYKRRLIDDIIYKFDVGYDRSFKLSKDSFPMECITFPVKDISGNCLFIARRAINTKLFHYPDYAIKPLYGLYELSKYAPENLDEIYVCESIFNCLTVWSYGKYAIALNGTGSSTQLKELKKLKYRKIILALDPDDAGINGCKKIYKALKDLKLITRLKIPTGKDINDLEKEEFLNLQEYFMNDNINF